MPLCGKINDFFLEGAFVHRYINHISLEELRMSEPISIHSSIQELKNVKGIIYEI